MTEVQAHERIACLQTRHENGHVGLRTAMRLYVHVLRAKQLFETVTGNVLRDIHYLASAVITMPRIALSVLIGQHTAHGFHHLIAHEVLTGDQLNSFRLTLTLTADDVKNLLVT